MFPPELSFRAFALGNGQEAIAPPIAAENGSFGALFGEVRAEITNFIANGSEEAVGATSLSAEGRLQQARVMAVTAPGGSDGEELQAFAAAVAPMAREAGQRLGVAPEVITAHAALESGWGQRPLRHPDGTDTHNLFGIKAGGAWSGDVASAATTEYENGVAQPRTERFRSYPDTVSAFRDFSKLLLSNPRYHGALNAGIDVQAYGQGLVRGGYATDPAYADKLARVVARLQSGS